MERSEIFEHIETLREDAYFRNVGNNKSELAFRESVADWISENFEEKLPLNEKADKAIEGIDKELLKEPRYEGGSVKRDVGRVLLKVKQPQVIGKVFAKRFKR